MAKSQPASPERRLYRAAVTTLLGAFLGLAMAFIAGIALVPRVRLVEVLAVVAGGIGGGAALTSAIVQFKQARAAARQARY